MPKGEMTMLTKEFLAQEPTRTEIDARRGALVLEFGTPWCEHCNAAWSHIVEAFTGFPQVPLLKIEDGRGKPLGRSFGVKLWPTLVFLKDGVEVGRLVRPLESGVIAEALAPIVS